jgi:hypothetical protein
MKIGRERIAGSDGSKGGSKGGSEGTVLLLLFEFLKQKNRPPASFMTSAMRGSTLLNWKRPSMIQSLIIRSVWTGKEVPLLKM